MRLGNMCTLLSDKITLLTNMESFRVCQVSVPTSWSQRRTGSSSNMPNQDHGGHAPGYFKHWTLQARTLLLNRSREEDDQDVLGPARHRHDEEVASVDPPLGALMCVNVHNCLVEKQAHVARKVLDECGATDAIGLQKETTYCTRRR